MLLDNNFRYPNQGATQSGAGGSSDLSDITGIIHNTAAQHARRIGNGPMNSGIGMAGHEIGWTRLFPR